MAQLIIEVPNDQIDRIKAGFQRRAGVEDINDMTVEDVRLVVIDFMKKVVRQHEKHTVAAAAEDGVTDVEPT